MSDDTPPAARAPAHGPADLRTLEHDAHLPHGLAACVYADGVPLDDPSADFLGAGLGVVPVGRYDTAGPVDLVLRTH